MNLDSIPTFLLKLCFDELSPTIINIINFSLSEGIFPSSFKHAIVHPLLKKPSLPDDDLNNFRPISNLNFISKILEKVVASRIQSHLLSNSLSSSFQSAYRMFPFHWNHTSQYSQWPHLSDGSWWGHFSYFFLIYLLPSILSIIPSFFIVFNIGLVFMVLLLTGFHLISPHVLRQSPSKIPLHLSQIFLVVYLKVPSLAHFFSLFIQLLLALSSQRTQSNTTSMLMTPSCTFLSLLQIQLLHLKYSPILSLTYSPGWTLTNCSSIHPKLNSHSLVQNNNGSNFLNLQLYLLAMISSQSALLLVILASSSILTCHSQIKLTPCLSLVIFISETSVVFVISFLFLQLQHLPIHSSPANLIIVIHSTMAFRKLTWTKYSAYKILWLVSLQIHQNLNTLHQYSKNYIGFQSNNASITNCVFLHIKRFKFSNLPIFTIVFLFLLTLCLQDHLIHRFCPSHMSEHLWVKGPFLSLLSRYSLFCADGTLNHFHSLTHFSVIAPRLWNSLPPDTRNSLSVSTFCSKLKTHLFKLAFPPWILSHPIIGLPTRIWFLFFLYF